MHYFSRLACLFIFFDTRDKGATGRPLEPHMTLADQHTGKKKVHSITMYVLNYPYRHGNGQVSQAVHPQLLFRVPFDRCIIILNPRLGICRQSPLHA